MDATTIACTKCNAVLSPELFTAGPQVFCTSCGSRLTAYLFPALSHATLLSRPPEAVMTDMEAGCFFHPAKKAVVACEGCGRFLCGLCDLDWQGMHLCSTCLETGKKKGKIRTLENSRLLYDHMAISLAVLPVIPPIVFATWIFTCITAPATIFICLRYWNTPGSLISRTKIRFILALSLALAEIGAWVWGIAEIVHEIKLHG
jgi:hypothetical protein